MLRDEYDIQIEFGDIGNILAYISIGDRMPLEKTVGRIAGEMLMCYPPGIPILTPGERITQEILDYIEYARTSRF